MFGNLGKMMKLAGELKEKMPQVQAKLEAAQFSADAGGGAVTATVNGKGALVDIRIAPGALADEKMSADMLGDAVKAAVAAAQETASQAAREAMLELTGGMSLPGMEGMLG